MSKIKGAGMVALVVVAAHSQASARPRWGEVRRVLDGDVIQLTDGSTVRYLGVDAPDVGSAHYAEALAANKRWVEGREVKLRYGLSERDVKGLWLAYVYVDGVMVNSELVREGMAIVTSLDNEESNLPDLLRAEQEARVEQRGVWADTPIEPYATRQQKRTKFPWASSDEIKRGLKK